MTSALKLQEIVDAKLQVWITSEIEKNTFLKATIAELCPDSKDESNNPNGDLQKIAGISKGSTRDARGIPEML